ncbi:MAG: glycosyltransferase [Marinobacter sp.]|uniref:glycosyltransferase n=1 Tax=Marinobacter sp. TaxID=50741 RepID=UPI00299F28AF|nr:glycosyltransferase [Marinobacter sp.]MDX1756686.1 glycosyltransferase [Marinobacter sp.]
MPDDKRGVEVSVIIPVYNAEKDLPDLFISIANQSFDQEKFELIFVDNGSSDSSLELLKSFEAQWEGRSKIVLEHLIAGSYAARNKGLRVAEGRFVVFTDADCLPRPNWLKNIVSFLSSHPPDTVGGGEVELFAQNSTQPTAVEKFEIIFGFPQALNIERRGYSVTANLFSHREVFEKVGLFDARLRSKGDYEWCQRATLAGCRLLFVRNVQVQHSARSSLRELVTKTRRVTGGQTVLKGLNNTQPKIESMSVLKQIKMVIENKRFSSAVDKIQILLVAALVFTAKAIEKVRLGLGGSAERR